MQIILAIHIFLEIISYIIILDIILSWLTLFGLNIRPKFVADIIDPMYKNIKKTIPTTFGPVDFTPIIVIFVIFFLQGTLMTIFPELVIQLNNL